MNKLSLLALLPALVVAQPRPTIDAKVVQVVPILSQEMRPRNVEQCRDVEVVTHHRDTLGPSVAGAIIGGLIGSGFGHGHGRAAATGIGAAVGMGVAQNAAQARDHVVVKERCDPVVHYEQVEVQRYQVTYELDGQRFVTTLDRQPGATITVRLAP
ncbi:glycine zipper 2TM domain-containing protein [Paucibacter sp. M5-1]|uniref:glycine zipper 2TM domain-containing protein n=1 Tax=Paucibacter sp. M5-1 TaxID=3015998 RepID=UPI0022B91902|nr:glycine zipper 2TM domain-containing protein [Paucibacter sp. M5-1]MCZ7880944.1 hypothetical protein [Paucibacter sp. M5-1]